MLKERQIVRIAMWSGPRNISTAMMRAWENRDDTFVCDEPLYAHYLSVTGIDHPGREQILAQHETDWSAAAAFLTGEIPGARRIFYQKHMAHHLLPGVGRDWLIGLTHAFLIRDPDEMLISLDAVTSNPCLEDTGLPQQCELFEEVCSRDGAAPPVLDAREVLLDPEGQLRQLCAAVCVPFRDAMLSWKPGRRETDGAWAEHWYANVERSTGFAPYRPKRGELSRRLRDLSRACRPYYERLYPHRILT